MTVSTGATTCATLSESDSNWGQMSVSAPTVVDPTMMAEKKIISLRNILIGIELCTDGESDDVFQLHIAALEHGTDIEVTRTELIE